MKPSICIITPGYLSSTPRVVKEADALCDAGMDVRVVHTWGGLHCKREDDRSLLEGKDWTVDIVRWSRHRLAELPTYTRYTAQQRLAERLPTRLWPSTHIAEQIDHRAYPAMARRAAGTRADLYIGHYPTGLAAAAYAAERHDALLGYDAEDFHVGEQPDNCQRVERIDFIERRYLPQCAHVSAASDGIADALADRYTIGRPLVLNNMFPLVERDALNGQVRDRKGAALSLYWFSQTVGLERGLQDAIRAAGLLNEPVQLHIRGTVHEDVRRTLVSLAEENGVADRLYFHPQVPPGELLARTAEHDVGLALEQGHTPNRSICVTNKAFYYPLAGLAVAATDVPGQRRVLGGHFDFSGLYMPGEAVGLARLLERWTDRSELKTAQTKALKMARTEWNWEIESEKLVDQVTRLLK